MNLHVYYKLIYIQDATIPKIDLHLGMYIKLFFILYSHFAHINNYIAKLHRKKNTAHETQLLDKEFTII